MRVLSLCLTACLTLFAQSAVAVGPQGDPMYQLGLQACYQSLYGDAQPLQEVTRHFDRIHETDMNPGIFCGCVASEFVENEPLQSFRMTMAGDEDESAAVFRDILVENFDACIGRVAADDSDDFIDGDLVDVDGYEENFALYQDGPNWAETPDETHCEFAIDGILEPDNFDRSYIQDWINDSGVDAESLCGCAAAVMQEYRSEEVVPVEASADADLYWSYMSRSIDQCQQAMWRRPLTD